MGGFVIKLTGRSHSRLLRGRTRWREGISAQAQAHLRHAVAECGCRITSIQRFLGHKEIGTTMIYARAHDQNMAEDYFTAMERVEQRLDIVPEPVEETKENVVNVLPAKQLLAWAERLALPELCQQERLEIAESLKQILSLDYAGQSPPVSYAG